MPHDAHTNKQKRLFNSIWLVMDNQWQESQMLLLLFSCTAEPVWAFEGAIRLLAQKWHVFQVVYDGHQPENPGDFTSVE